MQEFDYDLFVIGAGSGGVRASRIAASLGARVAVAEERYLGGTCVNVGCVPKKLFSYAAHFGHDFEDSSGFGWEAPATSFNWPVLRDNKNREISRLNGIYQSLLESNEVKIYSQRATLIDSHTLDVGGTRVTANYILIATGGWPFVPEFAGSDLAITSNEVFFMEEFPKTSIVVGGGYIAVEFAGILSGLGSNVTQIYRGKSILRGFDSDVSAFFSSELEKEVDLRLGDNIERIQRSDNGGLDITLTSGDTLQADCVLYATGRKANTANMGIEELGIELKDNGAIVTNSDFQTNVDNIYAVGDVIDRVTLTPVALAEGEIVARQLFATNSRELSYKNIPTAVFSNPNIGSVGLTQQQAVEQGLELNIYKSQFTHMKHTLSGRDTKVYIKMLVDKVTDLVVGIHLVGPDAGEIIQGMAVAMNCGATKADFDNTIGIHPTLAEEFVTLRTVE